MPKAYSQDLRHRVVASYQAGESAASVAALYKVSVACVYRWTELLHKIGSIDNLYKPGDRSVIKDDEKFRVFAEAHAGCALEQMAAVCRRRQSEYFRD